MPLPDGCKTTPCAPLKVDSINSSLAGLDLPQYRIRVTHDMDGHFVKADSVVEFLDAFLPYPSTAPKRRTRRKNPFEGLVDADKWVEAEVVVRFTEAVTSQKLCPMLVLTTSERTPDPKGVDKTQQKVDAGFFHPDDAPTNGQPGWPFDLVPVEFKNRKQGNIYDPLDDKAEDEGFESQADSRKDVRGQLTTL